MRHVHLGGGPVGRTQEEIVDSIRDLRGFVITGVTLTNKTRTREVDAVLVTPEGVWSVEGKGSKQSGHVDPHARRAWKVNGKEAQFAGGSNPIKQAREGAQMLADAAAQAGVKVGFIPAAVVVSGDVTMETQRFGDTLCLHTSELGPHLTTLTSTTEKRVNAADALAFLKHLSEDIQVGPDELAEFPTQATGSERSSKSQQRFNAASERAQSSWRRSNSRRVWFSAAGGVASIVFLIIKPEAYSVLAGALAWAAASGITWWMRSRREGPRKAGVVHLAGWAVSNAPYIGVAALLVSGWLSADTTGVADVLYMQMTTLLALGVFTTTLAGRSWVVYPPPMVVQQLDRNGKPTGTYFLVEPPAGRRAAAFTLDEAVEPPEDPGLLERPLGANSV